MRAASIAIALLVLLAGGPAWAASPSATPSATPTPVPVDVTVMFVNQFGQPIKMGTESSVKSSCTYFDGVFCKRIVIVEPDAKMMQSYP